MAQAAQQITWEWLRSLSRGLFDLDAKPLFGEAPPFPWKEIAEKLSRELGVTITLEQGEFVWKEAPQVTQEIKSPLKAVCVSVQSIDPDSYLLLNEQDLRLMMSEILGIDCTTIANLPEGFEESFYNFVIAQCCFTINETSYGKTIPVKIKEESNLPDEPMLCQDIWVAIAGRKFLVRFAMPKIFQEAFSAYSRKAFASNPGPLLSQIPTVLIAEAGRSYLTFNQWKNIHPGDFLHIDQLFYEPGSEKGRCLITFEGKPLFRCIVKEDGFKILEISSQNEVYPPMADQLKMGQPQGSPAPDSREETLTNEDHHEDDFEFEDEKQEKNEDAHLNETMDPQGMEEHETENDEMIDDKPPKASPQRAKTAAAPQSAPRQASPENSELVTANEIPLTLVVELAHIETTVQKMLELQPGNMIDIGMPPQNTVQLSINGRIVGRGELMRIGDSLGVRLLEIGPQK